MVIVAEGRKHKGNIGGVEVHVVNRGVRNIGSIVFGNVYIHAFEFLEGINYAAGRIQLAEALLFWMQLGVAVRREQAFLLCSDGG